MYFLWTDTQNLFNHDQGLTFKTAEMNISSDLGLGAGELAPCFDINSDKIPKKWEGLKHLHAVVVVLNNIHYQF